ncbi:ComF family protein [Pelagovum pacificum]|uniref:ComF family protein n=1 Tax=Pelagovum pacificum TaxID=2588711 RepID=A0A5C5GIH1_9RHOB|nr:ComF family protein [Pelagovum pacificum]QQA42909.1 ComF family protein [Pelagovum pacificum]TNY33947.1 ComF family protein [Pelagovum pacificum]
MQKILRAIYPATCVMCETLTGSEFGLCPDCWKQTPFITGLCCDLCGTPLPGAGAPGPETVCDDCLRIARPWAQGRAALAYSGLGRSIPLALKHGDRTDLVRPAARWMARAAAPLLTDNPIIAPVPLHWLRLARRRFNQSALLAQRIGRELSLPVVPDLLQRHRWTIPLDFHRRDERFAILSGAIRTHPRHLARLAGRAVLLVDDVMTTGATLAASTEALMAEGAGQVRVLVLARVAKDP